MKKTSIIDTCIYIVAVVMVILIAIFQNQLGVVFIVLSSGAFILGILALIKKQKYGFLACGCGIGGLLTYLVYNLKLLDFAESVTFMICISIVIVLFLTFIFSILNRRKVLREYNIEVEAEVIDLIRNVNTKKEYYKPVYKYEIKDMVYEVEAVGYINKFIPSIGDKKKILIKENDYGEVYFLPSKMQDIKDFCSILFLSLASILIIIYLFL